MNIIVIMLDSLRPDHLGCYGNPWIKTPNIDEFSREAVVFERAYAEGLPTLPVRTALFTGRYTLMWRGWQHLEPSDVTLAEILWDSGFTSAFITDTYHMHKPRMAYERGFDYVRFIRGQEADPYIIDPSIKVDLSKWHPKNYFTDGDREVFIQYLKNRHDWKSEEDHFIAKVVKAGIEWLESQVNKGRKDKLFLWLDCFDPHEPWDPPEEYYNLYAPKEYDDLLIIQPFTRGEKGGLVEAFTELEVRHIRAQYAGEVTLVDKWVGLFFKKLKELELWDNSLIVLLSDHGEPLGEHGIIRKVRPWPYEELSRIVFIMKFPNGEVSGKRIKAFVQTPDLLPTVLDLLKLPEKRSRWSVSPEVQGKSLIPIIRGEVEDIRDVAIAGHFGKSWSVRDEEFSLYLWPKWRTSYTFGIGPVPRQEKFREELYRIDRSYIPPRPEEWSIGSQPERDNVIEEFKDRAMELELKLRRELMRIMR
ncbi:MAG: sulfatase [Thermoprotei archaeon]|nr:MAG: sulfatase [Thermoprotei archaeon]